MWTKLSDDFGEVPPVLNLSDAAYRLYVQGLIYCNRNLTDGLIAEAAVGRLTTTFSKRLVAELTATHLWTREGSNFVVAEFLRDQLSRAQVMKIRTDRRAAGRAGGIASGESRRQLHRVSELGSTGPSRQAGASGPVEPTAEARASDVASDPAHTTVNPAPAPAPGPGLRRSDRSGLRPISDAAARFETDIAKLGPEPD